MAFAVFFEMSNSKACSVDCISEKYKISKLNVCMYAFTSHYANVATGL